MIRWCILLFASSSVFARTITMINDSPYPLTALIFDAQGTKVATVNVDRGATSYFDYEQTAFSPQHNSIYALYTVRWICRNSDRPYDYSQQKKDDKAPEYNTEFGHWINVSPGSTITAQGSPFGPCQCVTKKDKNSKKEPPTPDAQENDRFLNNGGTDWDNNGGPGSSTSELFPKNDQSSPFNSSPSRWKND